MKHYKIKVYGRVQGVYFRVSTLQEASRLNLKGFVQNEADGSVYIEVEGMEEQLVTFLAWCKIGSPMSEVEKIDIEEAEIVDFNTFEIRRK